MRFSANGTINWHNPNYMRIVSGLEYTQQHRPNLFFHPCRRILPSASSLNQSCPGLNRNQSSKCAIRRLYSFDPPISDASYLIPVAFDFDISARIYSTTWTRYMWKSVNLNLARILSAIKCQSDPSKIDSILSKFWRVNRLQHIRIHAVIKERTVFLDLVE